MRTASLVWLLLLGVSISVAAGAAQSWLATGTVTKVDGDTLYFLSRGNSVFRVNTSSARIFTTKGEMNVAIGPGDKVRIFGCLTKPGMVQAARVRVLASVGAASAAGSGPSKEVRVIVEKEPTEVAPQAIPPNPCPPPAPPCSVQCWEGKGIVIDIDYVGHQVKLQTTDTNYTVDVDNAQMLRGTRAVQFGTLNLGDTIWVQGTVVAANVIDGRMIRVLRTVSEAQNSVPLLPLTIVGVIQQIDYPSRTFKMLGPHTPVVISVDDNTDIYFQMNKKQFNDLKPGTKISMSGTGSLATGYAAEHIQIIGGP